MSVALRSIYCAALLSALAAIQIRGEAEQVRAGYRPLTHAPGRVPYSWDMFAIRIDRCTVAWTPPLEIEGERVSRWRDRTALVEFDTVYNHSHDYGTVAQMGCAYRSRAGTTAHLVCVTGDGGIHEFHFACP